MSHDQSVPSDYAGPVPTQRNPSLGAGTPPPRMPSNWLEPTNGDPQPVPGPDHDDDVVIIDDEQNTPACLTGPRPRPRFKGRLLVKTGDGRQAKAEAPRNASTAEHRVMILDTWKRSGLPAGDFAPLVGVSKHTLYAWKAKFEEYGPAGLMEQRRGSNKGSRLPELTKRAILMMKQDHPEWGVDRISDLLLRSQALAASPAAVAKVLHEDGFTCVEHANRPHKGQVRYFEAKNPNSMWQTDLFTFILKRQNQRVYLVAFMDDNSRFITTYGLHASQSTALVLETFRAGIVSYGSPAEVLTDNGSQYVTWRGKSQFQLECQKRGIKQTVSSPRHPQTLGKIERFWGSLWRECLESAVFADLGDARIRIGHYIDHYNFQRVHQGIDGLVPADRFFGAAPAVLKTISERVAQNALEISRNGVPKAPLYLTGNVDGQPFALHAQGDRVILTSGEKRTEIDFDPRTQPAVPPAMEPKADAVVPTPPSEQQQPEPNNDANAQSQMPMPVSPVGIVRSDWTGAEEQPPGVSPIDDLWQDETPSASETGGAS